MRGRNNRDCIVGVDEVGRGPLAGPVAVCALFASSQTLRRFQSIKESKQLSAAKREEWYARICQSRGDDLDFAVSFIGANIIDRKGITFALSNALKRSLCKIAVDPKRCRVLLDGGLHAPKEYVRQKTIIHGDERETAIAMASVIAKVLRDRRMMRLDKKYPDYGFATHKGYGTTSHIRAIIKHGPSPLHRRSFISRIEYNREI